MDPALDAIVSPFEGGYRSGREVMRGEARRGVRQLELGRGRGGWSWTGRGWL